ncbi:efflux RND transporter periplasmic adaptor subunit [Terrihabitans sp. PJ23]|uniref:Efflux RND transporter periplasmic adaptor subunit n=2 Tax=Terrihabitans rhizophilus TaxID=3092662 RepID=A0ABU4RJ35_9HYPH|nr:efflux RND transporter periplasmic adaptor subunit [Terrihabitans sp. PJ23]
MLPVLALGSAGSLFAVTGLGAQAADPAPAAPAVPVSVAVVEQKRAASWDEFSGRLEAVERVDVRSRVSGAVLSAHFREGSLVKKGDLLLTIDPDPYAAEVERQKAALAAAEARLSLARNEFDRGKRLTDTRFLSQSDLDQRTNAFASAQADVQAAKAGLRTAQLNLDYTQVRAPVTGRVGKLEVTVGNLVAAGPGAPVLTTLVSVDPIYASFSADEAIVGRALNSVSGPGGTTDIGRIPVEITTATRTARTRGTLQFVDNQVETASGTVRMRAVFENADGSLMAGQFARVSLGEAEPENAIAVSERAIGTDQDKKFVMVVGDDNKANYREVKIGRATEGLRVITAGLTAGERIVVNGLQRIRPGALVEPQQVPMATNHTAAKTDLAER